MVALQMIALSLALSNAGQPVLLDFGASWCGYCRQMDPVVQQMSTSGYAIQKIDIDRQPELAKRFGVKGVPCFVLVVDGREVARVEGATSRQKLEQMFASVAAPPTTVPRGSVKQVQLTAASGPAIPHVDAPALIDPTTAQQAPSAVAVPEEKGLVARLTASSVRLRINDSQGHSVGSGTIIDARAGEALIVTCGHVFRESKGKGKIEVDLLAPGAPQKLPARLVGYSLEPDVALLSIRPGCAVQPAQLAAVDYQLSKNEPVISIGCDHGGPSSARLTHITSLNKYLGGDNLQIAGQPVQGRSGGGLFTSEGLLIGVCNAADPKDNEGLFASMRAVHAELVRHGIDDVLKTASAPAAAAPEPASAATAQAAAVPLASQEQALVEQLAGQSEGAELICIVRSLNNPRAKSEIIVLDRASPQLLERLVAEGRQQPAQNQTSASASKTRR